jgi:hypothetical protein
MATVKERLTAEQEKLRKAETLLASAQQAADVQGKETTPGIEKASKEVARLRKSVAALRKQVTASEQKPLTDQQQRDVNAAAARDVLPTGIDDKLWNELKNTIPNLSADVFAQGGVGAGILVYQGQKKGTVKSPTGGMYTAKTDNVAMTNDVVNSFWTDKTVQKKVLNALVAAGNSGATQLDAFATWQSVVQQSAQLYAAGKGPKFTPIDILNMSITKAGGAKPDVTTYLDVPKDAELKQILKGRLFELIRKEPDDTDPVFQNLFNDIKKLYQKGETTTTTVDPKTGKKIVKRTGGVTDAMVQAKINKYYDENNQDFLEAKSLEATDYFSQWMRS